MRNALRFIPLGLTIMLLAAACSAPREASPYPLPATGLVLRWDTTYDPEVGIGIGWVQSTSEVDGYLVERAVAPFEEYEQIASLDAEREGVLDTDVTSGVSYRYRVVTVMGDYMVLDRSPTTENREFTAP